MLHFGLFDIRTDLFVLLVFVIVVLLQIFLCFKAKKNSVRLMPMYLPLISTIVFVTLGFIVDGWDGFGFFFLAICSAVLLVGSGIGWGFWAIIKKISKFKFDKGV